MLEKKEHAARRLSTLYGEGTDVPFKKVQENRWKWYNTIDHIKMQKTILR